MPLKLIGEKATRQGYMSVKREGRSHVLNGQNKKDKMSLILAKSNIPSHLLEISFLLAGKNWTFWQETDLRWALLQGTQADATCPFVFLCAFGEEKSGVSPIEGRSAVENCGVVTGAYTCCCCCGCICGRG